MIREWHVSDSEVTGFVADEGPELSRDTQTTTQRRQICDSYNHRHPLWRLL
jgi:hypothetical protein